jgi:hypothetical protein
MQMSYPVVTPTHGAMKGKKTGFFYVHHLPPLPSTIASTGEHVPAIQGVERQSEKKGGASVAFSVDKRGGKEPK